MIKRLDDFRSRHSPKATIVNTRQWSYITSGTGNRVLFLLPGGLGCADALFNVVDALAREYRIVAASFALDSLSIDEILAGLLAILDAEHLQRVIVVGTSYGGWVAQELAARHSDRVDALVLAHTFPLLAADKLKLRRSERFAAGILRVTPAPVLTRMLRLRVSRILLTPLRAARHADTASWEKLVDETAANGTLRRMAKHQHAVLTSASHGNEQHDPYDGPILIIESDNDPVVRPSARNALKRVYPKAEILTFPKTGHITSILAEDAYVDAIARFVESISDRSFIAPAPS